jgi:NAD-dependent deacetylase
MHGELLKARCASCGKVASWRDDLRPRPRCAVCDRPSLRPHVVWFGEMPLEMERIGAALGDCDLFVAIGTSGNVYPAAGFVAEVKSHGRARTIEINPEMSTLNHLFDQHRRGQAGDLVPLLVREILDGPL